MFRKLRSGGVDSLNVDHGGSLRVNTSGNVNAKASVPPPRSDTETSQGQPLSRSDSSLQSDRRFSVASGLTLVSSSNYLSPRGSTSKETGAEDPLGLTFIHGSAARDGDIIFVHGLGGSSLKTWSWERNPKTFWPAWLRHEEALSRFRVFAYGYNANFRSPENPLSIMDFSKDLLVRMKTHGRDSADAIGQKPIILVAHSMGGLVVKKALILGKNDPHFSEMLSNVHGIMFFSTPHQGSPHARTLNSFLSIISSTKVYVSELDGSSTSIQDISEQFRTICSQLHLISFYETQQTKLVSSIAKQIVSKDSGILNYPNEITIPIDADHHKICKFATRLSPNYVLATSVLRQLTRDLRTNVATDSAPSAPEDEAESLQAILGVQKNIWEDFDSNLAQAWRGSCEWLHERENFCSWLDGPDDNYAILWFTGMPGSGKSTLAAKTIRRIQQDRQCQYHFFIGAQPVKSSAAYCLRAIAFQLATTYPVFAEKLVELHKRTKFSAARQNFQAIWDTVFEGIVFKVDFGRTLYWVFDGLDEADTPYVFLRKLLQMKSKSKIKVLLFSQRKGELNITARSHPDSVRVESISIEHTLGDIRNYVSAVVAEVVPQDESLQNLMVDRIASAANGSFLWTRLALESLRESWHIKSDFERALNNVPNEIRSLYERMMHNVNSQNSRVRTIALRILTWAACSFRPLIVNELVEALEPELGLLFNLEETAIQTCGQFVRIEHSTVSLIHGSARQFLLETSAEMPINHDHLALVCLRYLSRDTWRQVLEQATERGSTSTRSDRLESVFNDFPFLKYAMHFWAYHVSLSTIDASALRRFLKKYVFTWIQAVALSGNLRTIPRAAQYLKKWARQRRKTLVYEDVMVPDLHHQSASETAFVERWATDLTRLVTKFGGTLAQYPAAIHRQIPPFCPQASSVAAIYYKTKSPSLTVNGLPDDDWDDKLARLSVDQDEMASVVRCGEIYFLTLLSGSGTVIVSHTETCEEVRRISHRGWVTLMEINKTGSQVVTGGRGSIKVWDASSGLLYYEVPRFGYAGLLNLALAGNDVIMGYDDCSIIAYNTQSETHSTLLPSHTLDARGYCPRFMVLSADGTEVAIGFPGRPVRISAMPEARMFRPEPRSIIRKSDWYLPETGDEIFNSPEILRWHPDGTKVYILYQDTVVLMRDFIDDTHAEFCDTGAREMIMDEQGTLMLTSNNSGSVSVWGLPGFNLIYRLQSDEFVRDLAFNPDGQRIYDVRGSGCNVWAPDVLVRFEDVDPADRSSSFNDTTVSHHIPAPVFAEDKSKRGRITALVTDDEDEFFCCGKDDGTVSIHDASHGQQLRRVTSHSRTIDIIAIAWSVSRRFIASADASGRIIAKRLKIKDDSTWAVYALFELRAEEVVLQLLFSHDESYLLITTDTIDRIWNLREKTEVCKKVRGSKPGWKWINHPHDNSQLIRLEPDQMRLYKWANLGPVEAGGLQVPAENDAPGPFTNRVPSFVVTGPQDSHETLNAVIIPENNRFLLYEVLPERKGTEDISRGTRLVLVQVANLTPSNVSNARKETLINLSTDVKHVLGSTNDRVVFLDHDNWVCTSLIDWDMESSRRRYFIPSDWVDDATLPLISVNRMGTLFCARNGRVAIVRQNDTP